MNKMFGHLARVALGALAVALAGIGAGQAAQWPDRPVTVIVPLPPGGPVDAVAREFAKHLTAQIHQPVVVENIAGAYGQIGLSRLNRSAADGHTLGIAASGMMVFTPLLEQALPYDTMTGFTPVSLMSEYANVLVAHPSVPAGNIDELIAYARAHPGKIAYASSGYGSSNHLSGELLTQKTGISLLHVPYKGTAPGRSDVIAGHVGLMFDVVSSSMPFIESGSLKALATTSRNRNPALPSIPTVSETLPDYEVTGWFALFGPPGMPEAVQTPLQRAVQAALTVPAFQEFLTRTGYEPAHSTPEALTARMRSDFEYWAPVVRGAAASGKK